MNSLLRSLLILPLKVAACIFILTISSGWSLLTVVHALCRCYRKGFRKYVHWKDRTKQPPPFHYKAWDEETRHNPGEDTKSWNHAYVMVPETGIRFHFVYTGSKPEHLAISKVDGETVKLKGNEEQKESKPRLLLCLHGYPENWFSWRHILRHFENHKNLFVVAVDMRGYGDTDKPKGKMAYHVNELVSDVKGIVKTLGYEKCTLLAHDWGALIGWEVRRTYPEILDKYIALNVPHPKAFYRATLRNPKQLLLSWYIFFYQMPLLPEFLIKLGDYEFFRVAFNGRSMGIKEKENKLTEEEIEVFKYSTRHSVSAPINYYRAMFWPFCQPGRPLTFPKKPNAAALEMEVPTRLIWGDKDGALLKQLAEHSRRYLDPKNGSKLIFVEGASHWVQQDRPEVVIRHIEEFLE